MVWTLDIECRGEHGLPIPTVAVGESLDAVLTWIIEGWISEGFTVRNQEQSQCRIFPSSKTDPTACRQS